jgi:hypothetical protein
MTKEEALDLQATVNGILAQAWADLRCIDVEVSLLDDVVTVCGGSSRDCRRNWAAWIRLDRSGRPHYRIA